MGSTPMKLLKILQAISLIFQNDLTNLKTTIDYRFNKLEKTVEKIHNELRVKLFEGVVDNLGEKKANNNPNESLSLNFEKEPTGKMNGQIKKTDDPNWKDVNII